MSEEGISYRDTPVASSGLGKEGSNFWWARKRKRLLAAYRLSGSEQSMKPMIGKSIDQSMTIDALLVNWHRLASVNRCPIDNHTKVVATHRLSSIGVKKSRYPTRSSLYIYALAVRTNV